MLDYDRERNARLEAVQLDRSIETRLSKLEAADWHGELDEGYGPNINGGYSQAQDDDDPDQDLVEFDD